MEAALLFIASVRPGFLPPLIPLALAALNPALVRSLISSRSNSAKEPKILNISRPCDVDVFIPSLMLSKLIFRSLSWVTISINSFRDRPSLSSFHTTKISPARSLSKALASSGRSFFTPDTGSL